MVRLTIDYQLLARDDLQDPANRSWSLLDGRHVGNATALDDLEDVVDATAPDPDDPLLSGSVFTFTLPRDPTS